LVKENTKIKIAIFHAFFSGKGGAERFVFNLRNHFSAGLFTGAVNFNSFNPDSRDSFSQKLFNPQYELIYLHKDINTPVLRLLKRYLFFAFSFKIKKLLEYDVIIFSGSVMFVPRRINKLRNKYSDLSKPKLIMYCHTTPRKFTDQFDGFVKSAPKGLKLLYKIFGKIYLNEYIKDMKVMDVITTNSENTHKRIKKYTGFESKILFPPVDTSAYKYISRQDYFLSYARLEEMKRVPLILEAFTKMKNKKLVICSTGPLHNWFEEQIKMRNLDNILFEGFVSDERLSELIGNCYAGIYIPVDEDFGMTQIELMAAGKPVIGVEEGGLLETVIDGETGIMLPPNPTVDDLVTAIENLTLEKVILMKDKCIEQANKFSDTVFYEKIEKECYNVINK